MIQSRPSTDAYREGWTRTFGSLAEKYPLPERLILVKDGDVVSRTPLSHWERSGEPDGFTIEPMP